MIKKKKNQTKFQKSVLILSSAVKVNILLH